MSDMKTQPSDRDVGAFLDAVEHPRRRADAQRLNEIFKEATGFTPVIWGDAMVGYGRYDYTYASGRSGSFFATGFAPRKANLVVYIMPGYGEFSELLARLGKHRLGRSCLYLNKLDDVDEEALRKLIRAGLNDLATHWPVRAS